MNRFIIRAVARMARVVRSRPQAGTADDDYLQIGDGWMRGLFRALFAGWGAKKMGGGCISTILIFIILWFLLRGIGI